MNNILFYTIHMFTMLLFYLFAVIILKGLDEALTLKLTLIINFDIKY